MSVEASSGAKQHEVALRLGAALQQEACPQVGLVARPLGATNGPPALPSCSRDVINWLGPHVAPCKPAAQLRGGQ